MEKKRTKIIEWIIICLFIAILVSIASIQIYRAVVNLDRYGEMQTEKSFTEMAEKMNDAEKIKYIKIEIDGEEKLIYDVPSNLFDDISCNNFKTVDDLEKQREIFSGALVAVVYEDETYTAFFITDDNELYWDTNLKIECPSLMKWLTEIS